MEGMGGLNGLPTGVVSRKEEPNQLDPKQLKINEDTLKKACADFESIFISHMLKTMRSTVPQGKNNFPGKDIYSTLVDQKVAEDLAKRGGGLGLQEMLLRQLNRSGIMGQEAASGIGNSN
ncbi:MAG: rod-binding protein [Desulfobacterales bacterium]|nr:rod-binding protein [Desulfobacterales bacterium]